MDKKGGEAMKRGGSCEGVGVCMNRKQFFN
jgi:hypothetical protein